MATYLPPVEKPRGLIMKLVYALNRRQFGMVVTPISVFAARLPVSFGSFYGKVSKLDKKLTLSPATAAVIREQVARMNMCMFCMDAGRWFATKESPENAARFDALYDYPTSTLFTAAERAALDYTTELTMNKEVEPETFARVLEFYSEREICDIVWLVASEHLYNLTNGGLGIGSDGLCELKPPADKPVKSSAAG